MAGKKKAAPKAPEAPKADAPKEEPAKSPVISTDSVKDNVYRVDMGESIP